MRRRLRPAKHKTFYCLEKFVVERDITPNDSHKRRKEHPTVLMRTDPFRELDRVAQQVFGTNTRPAAMPIDAYRHEEEFVVQFDLPGVEPDAIDLTVERNVLTVHAERRRSVGDDVELLIGERPQGTFSRQLFLGDTLDTEHLAAEYVDGVLTIRLPVKAQAKPRKIDVVAKASNAAINANSSEVEPVGAASA
jgi:HSP20 family protein